jgi:hypothetical protein
LHANSFGCHIGVAAAQLPAYEVPGLRVLVFRSSICLDCCCNKQRNKRNGKKDLLLHGYCCLGKDLGGRDRSLKTQLNVFLRSKSAETLLGEL